MADVVVLGTGPAGMAAGLAAARRGLQTVVVGPTPPDIRVDVDGTAVDLGIGWFPSRCDPSVEQLLATLHPAGLPERSHHRVVHVAGCWTAAPAQTAALLRHHRLSLSSRRLLEQGAQHVLRRTADTEAADGSYADVVRDLVGPSLARVLHEPFAAKVFGRPAERLSAAVAEHRPGVPGSWTHRADHRVRPLPGGIAGLTRDLADRAVAAGAQVLPAVGVESLSFDADGRAVVTTDRGVVHTATLIATVAAEDLTGLGEDPELIVARHAFPRRAIVHLLGRVDAPLQRDAVHELPAGPSPVARLRTLATTDGHLLHAEFPADRDDPLWQVSPQALAEEVLDALDRTDLPRPSLSDLTVHRVNGALDVLHRGWPTARRQLHRWARRRQVALVLPRRPFSQPHVDVDVATALAAVAALGPDGRLDVEAWWPALTQAQTALVLPG